MLFFLINIFLPQMHNTRVDSSAGTESIYSPIYYFYLLCVCIISYSVKYCGHVSICSVIIIKMINKNN